MRTWGRTTIIEFTPPITEEIRNARPLGTVLPQDALTHAMLIAATLCAGTEDDRAVSSYFDDRDEITTVTGNIIDAVFATLGNPSIIR